MKKSITLIPLLLYLTALHTFAWQEVADHPGAGSTDFVPKGVGEVKIGEKIPDILLENVLNHPMGEVNISDYKDKILILDFWATWCSPCVAAMPKVREFNEKYGDKLQVLPVTYEKTEKVQDFITRKSKNWKLDFPMATDNSVMAILFPHRLLPHYVWIDGEGIVRAITGGDAFNETEIEQAIAGNFSAKNKSEQRILLIESEGIIEGNNHIKDKGIIYQSALTKYQEGWPMRYQAFSRSDDGKAKLLVLNHSLKLLYMRAYSYDNFETYIGKNRVDLEVSNPDNFNYTGNPGQEFNQWMQEGNGYCFELIIPEKDWENRFKIFQNNLDTFFPQYIARIENREKTVLILAPIDGKAANLNTNNGKPFVSRSPDNFKLINGPLQRLVDYLNFYMLQHDKRPLVNESGIDKPVDMVLEANLSDINEINKALKPYGLIIQEGKKDIPILVIRDNPHHLDKNQSFNNQQPHL